MLVGVISDTHGNVAATTAGAEIFRTLRVACVLHCGDIGSADVVPCFSDWPTHFVLGNVDIESADLPRREIESAIQETGQRLHGRVAALEMEHVCIALLHGDNPRQLRETITSGRWDLVCHGHTHFPCRETIGRTLVVNPGAVHRAAPPSVATIQIPSLEVFFHTLSANRTSRAR